MRIEKDKWQLTGRPFSERETDLAECLGHLMHVTLEPDKAPWHMDWAEYHLKRACVGTPAEVVKTLSGHFNRLKQARGI